MAGAALDVALVIEHFSPSRGGGERWVADLARGLCDRGHRVTVYAAESDPSDPRVSDPRLSVRLLPSARHPKWLRKLRFARASRVALAGGHQVVHAVGKALGFTLLNPHGGAEEAWLAQNFRAYEDPVARALARAARLLSLRHHVLLGIERAQYRPPGPAAVIAISDMVKRDLVRRHGIPEDRVAVVYNGVDLARFHPGLGAEHRAPTRRSLGVGDQELLLLFVGNNFRLKGVATLVRATALLRRSGVPARAVVVGRDDPSRFRRVAAREGVREAVLFPGPEPRIERYYAAADLLVYPSYYDACALVTLEALACGLPVVTTRWNGASGVMTPGSEGEILEDPSDASALAEAVRRTADPGRREAASRAARATAERHPASEGCDRVIAVYRTLLEGRPVGDHRDSRQNLFQNK
ncbi:MAG: glycosyltransferase family 4 protein [Planctomycetales bacterium]|nr:glycosyltransferase family 4 protein [Planctomycetales bacterium]